VLHRTLPGRNAHQTSGAGRGGARDNTVAGPAGLKRPPAG
jgi:hypothetical protein